MANRLGFFYKRGKGPKGGYLEIQGGGERGDILKNRMPIDSHVSRTNDLEKLADAYLSLTNPY